MNSRRHFLQGFSGLVGASMLRNSAGLAALHGLTHGLLTKAMAAESSTPARKYIDLYIGGGFHGASFYLPLKPYSSESYTFNTWTANNWVEGAPVFQTHSFTHNGETLQLPKVWSMSIPVVGGGSVPMTELAKNMMFLRGFHNPLDSHELNSVQVIRPDATASSITGMVGDRSTKPIPVTQLWPDRGGIFAAQRVGAKTITTYNNPLTSALSSFSPSAEMNQILSRRQNFETAFQTAMRAVSADAHKMGAENLLASVASAESLLRNQFGDLAAAYNTLRNKYLGLIASCRDMSSLLTEAISPEANSLYRNFTYGSANTFCSNADLRTILTSTSNMFRLSEAFAMTEFLIMNNLSDAITMDLGGPFNLSMESVGNPIVTSYTTDMHEFGVGLSIPSLNFMGRCLSACLYELTQRLRSQNMFGETVIKMGSEFNRSARHDGSGGDHAWQANSMALLSGSIQTPYVLGNISVGSSTGQFRGTWGQGTGITHEGSPNTILNLGHYASSICNALRVPSPTSNFAGIVTTTSQGIIVPSVDRGRNTA